MLPALFVFVVVSGAIFGSFAAWDRISARMARRRLDLRLRDGARLKRLVRRRSSNSNRRGCFQPSSI